MTPEEKRETKVLKTELFVPLGIPFFLVALFAFMWSGGDSQAAVLPATDGKEVIAPWTFRETNMKRRPYVFVVANTVKCLEPAANNTEKESTLSKCPLTDVAGSKIVCPKGYEPYKQATDTTTSMLKAGWYCANTSATATSVLTYNTETTGITAYYINPPPAAPATAPAAEPTAPATPTPPAQDSAPTTPQDPVPSELDTPVSETPSTTTEPVKDTEQQPAAATSPPPDIPTLPSTCKSHTFDCNKSVWGACANGQKTRTPTCTITAHCENDLRTKSTDTIACTVTSTPAPETKTETPVSVRRLPRGTLPTDAAKTIETARQIDPRIAARLRNVRTTEIKKTDARPENKAETPKVAEVEIICQDAAIKNTFTESAAITVLNQMQLKGNYIIPSQNPCKPNTKLKWGFALAIAVTAAGESCSANAERPKSITQLWKDCRNKALELKLIDEMPKGKISKADFYKLLARAGKLELTESLDSEAWRSAPAFCADISRENADYPTFALAADKGLLQKFKWQGKRGYCLPQAPMMRKHALKSALPIVLKTMRKK